jgi:hypothetical protein
MKFPDREFEDATRIDSPRSLNRAVRAKSKFPFSPLLTIGSVLPSDVPVVSERDSGA